MPLRSTHRALVRENLRNNGGRDLPLRKRRRLGPKPQEPVTSEVVDVDTESTDDFEDVDLEDVDFDAIANNGRVSPPRDVSNKPQAPVKDDDSSESEFDSDDFDDLEDVDLDMLDDTRVHDNDRNETLTFSIDSGNKKAEKTKKKRTFVPISKHERKSRKLIHKLVLFSMVCHGAVRNKWCSDPRLMQMLKKTVSAEIADLFKQDKEEVLAIVKAKRFVDGLRKLSTVFSRKFKVNSPGIQRKGWGVTEVTPEDKEKKLSFDKFSRCVKTFRGSRDTGAQAFVAVLRSIGVNARLVFSVQVPDYRSIRPVKDGSKPELEAEDDPQGPKTPRSEFEPVFIPNPRQAMLAGIRSSKKKAAEKAKQRKDESSNFPVFWIEVWNKHSRKWITVDPIMFKVVEVMPMRRKCKFEAPATDESHQTWYVIAYDRHGCVRDVTRRYTQYYNAKTSKRRIGFTSEEDEHWYRRMLRSVGTQNRPATQAEAMELKEFHDRHICEGTPNNMADFKNHPVYALESQLRQDEIVYPNDDFSRCGTFRSSNKSSIISVYKRSCVYKLKTPKAWHMNGRVLKVGAQPLKTKKAQMQFTDEDGDDDGIVRLYAEFQTELYRPPPIVDGKIAKNAFGNVEIFRPTMVPENGYLVEASNHVPMKMLETAARWVLNIDYAKAIVSFEFGQGQKGKRAPTAKEGGVLIDIQYKEAMLAVLEGLKEQAEQEQREAVELNALKSWNFFMKKLQIISRLDRSHGKVSDSDASDAEYSMRKEKKHAEEDEEEDGYYSVGSDNEVSDEETRTPNSVRQSENSRTGGDYDQQDEYGGGFLAEDANSNQFEEGGFFALPEDTHPDGNVVPEEEFNGINESSSESETKVDPNAESETAVSRAIPKRKKTPRTLRARSRPTRTAETMQMRKDGSGPEQEVIDLESEASIPTVSQFEERPQGIRTRRATRSSTSSEAKPVNSDSDAVVEVQNIDTDEEEEELGIEYSDSP